MRILEECVRNPWEILEESLEHRGSFSGLSVGVGIYEFAGL
jgi:hypothetical protein